MSKILRSHAVATILLASTAAFVAVPQQAIAKTRQAVPAPEIFNIAVDGDEGVRAGAELTFNVEGSPRGKASVVLGKSNITVALKETSSGTYSGTYTVRSRDRIDPAQPITVRLTSGSRTVSHNAAWPASFRAPAVAAAAPPAIAPTPVAPIRVENFRMWPAQRIEPGRELHFLISAAPGAAVNVEIPGVTRALPLRETSPGRYEGTYTVRQRDDVNAFGRAVATLRNGPQVATARLANPVMRDTDPPTISGFTPRAGEVVPAGVVQVAGVFDDHGGRGVDPASVRIVISGRDVTPQARITTHDFSFRGELPPGRYTAEVAARDLANNAVAKSWNFEVRPRAQGAGPQGAGPQGTLPPAGLAPTPQR